MSFVVLSWSNSGNFPGGPNLWNGQPLALLPAGTWFTPNTKPAAEEFNYLFGNIVNDLNFIYGNYPQSEQLHYFVPGTFTTTVPAGVTLMRVYGWGGGGGGAGGWSNSATPNNTVPGGGGGAGARGAVTLIQVIPGHSLQITVPSGGAGGAGGAAGSNVHGTDGSDGGVASVVDLTAGAVVLCSFAGGAGGSKGDSVAGLPSSAGNTVFVYGGQGPANTQPKPDPLIVSNGVKPFFPWNYGAGGPGIAIIGGGLIYSGTQSPQHNGGGVNGTFGTDSGTSKGGGVGGGGGGGPLSVGGAGGNGGNGGGTGANGGAGSASTMPTNPFAFTQGGGAGGGGGGGGGSGSSGGAGGAGAAGDGGAIILEWVGYAASPV